MMLVVPTLWFHARLTLQKFAEVHHRPTDSTPQGVQNPRLRACRDRNTEHQARKLEGVMCLLDAAEVEEDRTGYVRYGT